MYDFTLKVDGTEIKSSDIVELELTASLDALDCLVVRTSLDPANLTKALPCKAGAPWTLTIGSITWKGDIVRVNYQMGFDPCIVLVGLESIHRLRGAPFGQVFTDPKHTIITTMANSKSVTIKGDAVKATASELPLVTDSILATAKRYAFERNYALFYDGTNIRFAPRDTAGASVTVAWGKDTLSMDMAVDISQVATKVDVYGRDYRKGTDAVTYSTKATDLKKLSGGDTAITYRNKASALDMVFDKYLECTTATEAQELAIGELCHRAEQFVGGTLRCMGIPDAAPTKKLSLTGVPWPLTGPFVMSAVSHVFGRAGHRTTIEFYSDSLPSP